MKIQPIKGMPDFYPREQEIIDYLRKTWIGLGASFGYKNYEGPILEPIELYLEKTSEEIISGQTFLVKDRKDKVYVMRPEMTPTLARMIVNKEFELHVPIRWQSFGRFFRYEKPQKGRTRAFYQWNIDLIGEDSISSDFEILELAVKSLSSLGLSGEQISIRYSNRAIIQNYLIRRFGLYSGQIPAVLRVIDRMDKVTPDISRQQLVDTGLEKRQSGDILSFFLDDSVEFEDEWLSAIKIFTEQFDLADYLRFDKKIIRGFDYYTGLVFEAWANASINRAVFGGGRYDNLTRTMGGKRALPGVGFAVGDVAITEVLKEFDLLFREENCKSVFIPLNVTAFIQCKRYAARMREQGLIAVVMNDYSAKLQKTLKYANAEQFGFAVILGEEELESCVIRVKDLQTRQEYLFPSDQGMDRLIAMSKRDG